MDSFSASWVLSPRSFHGLAKPADPAEETQQASSKDPDAADTVVSLHRIKFSVSFWQEP